jgi:hypothetical protein
MFGRRSTDIELTLTAMLDQARVECRSDQYAMVRKVGEWLREDRRFDSIADKEGLAKEALSCRQSGRTLDLSPRLKSGATSSPGYISRNV